MSRRAALAVLVAVLLLAACGGASEPDVLKPLPKPEGVELAPATTAPATDLSETELAAVRGTTSTVVALGPGPLTLTGRVDGPDGVLPGASVRVERLVSGKATGADLVTGADGTWVLPNVMGGRYRVRAWQAPVYAMERARVFFVGTSLTDPIVLRVDRYDGRALAEAIAPSPPPYGAAAELRVRVTTRVVNDQGRVTSSAAAGVQVALAGSGAWQADTSATTFTDADGVATWEVRCLSPGHQPLSVILDGTEAVELQIADCVDYSTTTTASTVPSSTSSTTSTTAHR